MPNNNYNRITFSTEENWNDFVKRFKHEGEHPFDFNDFIPMPKELNVDSGSITDEAIMCYCTDFFALPAFYASRYVRQNEFSEGNWCSMLYDRLKKQYEHNHYNCDNGKTWERLYSLGRRYVHNYDKYGCTTWYEWCNKYWNTKWNAYDVEWGEDYLEFFTAWDAPTPIFEAISKLYPTETVSVTCWDEGGWYNYDADFENGKETYHEDNIIVNEEEEDGEE